MSNKTTVVVADNHQFQSACCLHLDTKKAMKFGKKCAICKSRVWQFWKTLKCRDCKTVVHRSCVATWKKDTAQKQEVSAKIDVVPVIRVKAAVTEVTAITVNALAMTKAMSRARAEEATPMYPSPRPWVWENITEVTVDCRRRPGPLTVTVNHGRALVAAMFAELFTNVPAARRRRSSVRPPTPVDTCREDAMEVVPCHAAFARVVPAVRQRARPPGATMPRGTSDSGDVRRAWRKSTL